MKSYFQKLTRHVKAAYEIVPCKGGFKVIDHGNEWGVIYQTFEAAFDDLKLITALEAVYSPKRT